MPNSKQDLLRIMVVCAVCACMHICANWCMYACLYHRWLPSLDSHKGGGKDSSVYQGIKVANICTIQIPLNEWLWFRHAGHCWRSRDELKRDVLLWTPTHSRAKAGRPARTYIQQLCEDTDVVLKTCLGQWTIGRSGERGSGISVLPAWHDDEKAKASHNCKI